MQVQIVARDVALRVGQRARVLRAGDCLLRNPCPAAQFKAFADATGERWFKAAWKDKLAAGFTVSGSRSRTIAARVSAMESPPKGLRPLSSSYSTMPRLNWSVNGILWSFLISQISPPGWAFS